jgi:hypothetical protein
MGQHQGKLRLPHLTEAQFLGQVLQLCTLMGWKTLHIRPGRTASGWRTCLQGSGVGFPDILALKGPRLLVAELKTGQAKPTVEQAGWLGAFADVGAEVHCWHPDDWDQIERVLRG